MITTMMLAAQAAGGGSAMPILMMVAIFVIMWFFMIRPQQKRQKEIRNFQNALQEGTKVITGGGIYGVVKRIDVTTNIIEIEIARGVVVEVDKSYVFASASGSQASGGK